MSRAREEHDLEGVKWMDLDEFMNEGFLQEVNRQFFHPRGLALAVTVDACDRVLGITGVWDCRDDPEGVIFDKVDSGKVNRVLAQRAMHYSTRRALFGQRHASGATTADVQPPDWKPDGKTGD